jgi:stearoyl-CoA desaturase (delta-9 desaturase)
MNVVYEPGRPHTLPVLMAHVYYRALLTIPSLIYSWVLDCKDRQLTNALTTYTSTYFSPVLIKAELEHVRTSAASGELVDEKMSVKVVSTSGSGGGTGGEVMASYTVDEHQLEIRIRIPGDWPLHRVEVKDVKRVGVDENRWRAWTLGVQQAIWAHVSFFSFQSFALIRL